MKMRQAADGGLKQETPEVTAPVVFTLNQSNAVCLPVVSDSHKLVWVRSDQIDLQVGGVAELEKAFDSFPYLTEKQTAALAQRCSLHPDQVRVWFMVQRLRYGISWDYRDIPDVWRKVQPNHRKGKLQNRMEKETKKDRRTVGQKKEVEKSDGKKERKVREQQSRRMMGQHVKSNEQWKRKRKQEPVKKVKKRKRISTMCKMGAKRLKQIEKAAVKKAGEADIRRDQRRNQRRSSRSMTTACATKKNKGLMPIKQCPPDEPLDGSPLQTKALNVPPLSESLTDLLKVAFCHCQYPNRKDYIQLASVNGVPRHVLTKWFGDMRYSVKKRKPLWMSQEQHSQALANIKYQQCLKELAEG